MEYDDFRRQSWAGKASAYEESFEKLCAHTVPELLDAARVAPDLRVLDVGCGTGAVTAAAVARRAITTAVDAEPSMVLRATARVPAAVVDVAALPDLPYSDGSFDAVVANFVLNHVGRPRRSTAELSRLARPGGRVAVTIWPQPAPPLQQLWHDVIAASDIEPISLPALDLDDDFARTPEGLRGLLTGAGLVDIECVELSWQHRVDRELWWAGATRGVASIGFVVERQAAEGVARMKATYDALSARYAETDGWLALPVTALLAVGSTPARRR